VTDSSAIVETPLALVDFDAGRARRDTDSHVYSDLLFFHSLGDSSPGAVTGKLTGGRVEVVSRSRYAAIAQDLGLGTIKVSLPPDTPQAELAEFLGRPGVRLISGREDETHAVSGPTQEWHVVAFDWPLTDAELRRFTQSVREVFPDARQATETFRAESDPGVVYFRAWTPHDRTHALRFLAVLQRLDRDIAPVRSYRGSRFRHQRGE